MDYYQKKLDEKKVERPWSVLNGGGTYSTDGRYIVC